MRDTFDGAFILDIARRFDSDAEGIQFIRKSHNYIYKVTSPRSFYLRITSDTHRTRGELESEMHLLNYLHDSGADVVTPIPALNGETLISLTNYCGEYYAAAFTEAQGRDFMNRGSDIDHSVEIGAALGKLHKLTEGYSVPVSFSRRRDWSKSQHLVKAPELFKRYDIRLYDAFFRHMDAMKLLENTDSNFGLTHGDFLLSNYLIDEDKRVTIFDFDECEYSWFAADLAINMHCLLIAAQPLQLHTRTSDAVELHYRLLKGYSKHREIAPDMIFGLEPHFRTRDFIYISTILESGELVGWNREMLDSASFRAINIKPFLEYDKEKCREFLIKSRA